jgi:hypothetical protein
MSCILKFATKTFLHQNNQICFHILGQMMQKDFSLHLDLFTCTI